MNKIHGLHNHPLRFCWSAMKQRCYNQKNKQYKDYGGRGISICDIWINDFISFYKWAIKNGWEKGLTIDRIDNDGNYEPNNCRFITREYQNRNTSRVKLIEYDGNFLTLSQFANEIGASKVSVAQWYREEGIISANELILRNERAKEYINHRQKYIENYGLNASNG